MHACPASCVSSCALLLACLQLQFALMPDGQARPGAPCKHDCMLLYSLDMEGSDATAAGMPGASTRAVSLGAMPAAAAAARPLPVGQLPSHDAASAAAAGRGVRALAPADIQELTSFCGQRAVMPAHPYTHTADRSSRNVIVLLSKDARDMASTLRPSAVDAESQLSINHNPARNTTGSLAEAARLEAMQPEVRSADGAATVGSAAGIGRLCATHTEAAEPQVESIGDSSGICGEPSLAAGLAPAAADHAHSAILNSNSSAKVAVGSGFGSSALTLVPCSRTHCEQPDTCSLGSNSAGQARDAHQAAGLAAVRSSPAVAVTDMCDKTAVDQGVCVDTAGSDGNVKAETAGEQEETDTVAELPFTNPRIAVERLLRALTDNSLAVLMTRTHTHT